MSINRPNFEPQEIEVQKNPENTKNALADLWKDIFNTWNVDRLPYREELEMINYTKNYTKDFDNFLKSHLPLNNLEVA